jgi:hypothetical protein
MERSTVRDQSDTQATFCQSERISRSQFFKMRREGWGPAEMHVGRLIRISPAAKQRWRRQRERAAALGIRGALPAHEIAALDDEAVRGAALGDVPLSEVPVTCKDNSSRSLEEEPP